MEVIKLHPPVVHFAMALPFALLVLDLYYRYTKKNPDSLHLIFTLLASLSVIGATLSGMVAHEPIEDKLHSINVFETHELAGFILGFYFALLAGVRFGFERFSFLRNLFSLLIAVGVLFLFLQGSLGGSIVYDHMIKPWLEKP